MSASDPKCALGLHFFVLCNVQNSYKIPEMCNTLMLSSCSCIAVAGQVVVLTIEINLFPSALWITHTMPPCHTIIHTIPYLPHGLAHHTTCVPAGSAARPPYKSRPCLTTHCLANDAQFFLFTKKQTKADKKFWLPQSTLCFPCQKAISWGYSRHPKAKWLTNLVILFCCK